MNDSAPTEHPVMPLPHFPNYQQIDPNDIRVGRRYQDVDPERAHDFTVFRVTLIGDRIRVETFGGKVLSYPVGHPTFVSCDVPGT